MLESVDEQDFLIQAMPELYFITDHYRGWASVLARLPKLRAPECRRRLEQSWRLKAPRKLVKQLDATQGKPPPPRRPAKTKGGAHGGRIEALSEGLGKGVKTSHANVLRSSCSQSTLGICSFFGSFLSADSGATLSPSSLDWGRRRPP